MKRLILIAFCLPLILSANADKATSWNDELLTKIHTPSGDNNFEYDPHSFNEGSARDWWGFCNGRTPGTHQSPNLTLENTLERTLNFTDGTNRNISSEYMKAKILTKAIYPTGAVVQWEYEPHRFDTPLPENSQGKD